MRTMCTPNGPCWTTHTAFPGTQRRHTSIRYSRHPDGAQPRRNDMTICRHPLRQIAAAALLVAASVSQAGISTSSAPNIASFASLVGGTIDTFSDLEINSDLGTTSLNRTAGSFAYSATTQTGFFVVPAAGTVALSTGTFSDTITFGSFGPAVYAFGGNFFGTNVLGELASGALTITATDINGLSLSSALPGNSLTGFLGFLSDVPLASVTLAMTSPNTNVYASIDNIVAAVPEPASWALLLGGLVALRTGMR